MSFLVAIEGGDGAGKATAAASLATELAAHGHSATVVSFPRYDATVGGIALGSFLAGRITVEVSPKGAAVLYALDRLESLDHIERLVATNEIVIFDRYTASSMAYQAAMVEPEDSIGLMQWIYDLETQTFGIPPTDLAVYLDTPVGEATKLMLLKDQRTYTDELYDQYESNLTLQAAVRRNYEVMSNEGLAGPWITVRTCTAEGLRSPQDIGSEIADHVIGILTKRSKDKFMPL